MIDYMTTDLADLRTEYDAIALVDDASIVTIEEFERRMEGDARNVVADLNAVGLHHQLVNGMYMRCLNIPKGLFLTGMIHKANYLDICAHGDITVKSFLHDGSLEDTTRYEGFHMCTGVPGRKRIGYAHEDTLWVTVERTDVACISDALGDVAVSTMSQFKELGTGE